MKFFDVALGSVFIGALLMGAGVLAAICIDEFFDWFEKLFNGL